MDEQELKMVAQECTKIPSLVKVSYSGIWLLFFKIKTETINNPELEKQTCERKSLNISVWNIWNGYKREANELQKKRFGDFFYLRL